MAYTSIPSTDTDAESPIDQTLMDTIRTNLDDLDSRASGAGGGGGADVGKYVELENANNVDNVAYNWRRRFSLAEGFMASSRNMEGFDLYGTEYRDRFVEWVGDPSAGVPGDNNTDSNSSSYIGMVVNIGKDNGFSFKSKVGENYFILGHRRSPGSADVLQFYVDGVLASTYGLVDENNSTVSASFTSSDVITKWGTNQHFYGLDENKEQIITLKNNSATDLSIVTEYIEVGFRKESFTIDNTVKVNPGRGLVRGTAVSWDEADITFTESTGYGKTSAVKVDSGGNLTALNGYESAQTQVKAEQTIAFSGAVTTLPVQNANEFKNAITSGGICLLNHPYGHHYIFSYTGTTTANINANSIDGIVWHSKPDEDFTPQNNFDSGTQGDATGDLNICLIAKAPILVDSSNNKLDFSITVNGTTTTHVATITSGYYSADLVPLGDAITDAMSTIKSLDLGEYYCKYDHDRQRWVIGVNSRQVSELQLLFSSGANQANSIHGTLGYGDTDLTGSSFYQSSNDRQHLASKIFRQGEFEHPDSRIFKYSFNANTTTISDEVSNLRTVQGLFAVRGSNSQNDVIKVYPDNDSCGMSFTFLMHSNSCTIYSIIDNQKMIYSLRADQAGLHISGVTRGRPGTFMLTWPRGTREIELGVIGDSHIEFDWGGSTDQFVFLGGRQYYTKPPTEELSLTDGILKAYDIAPLSLYSTAYFADAGTGNLYVPQPSGDNVDVITESGTWAGSTGAGFLGGTERNSLTAGAYVEIEFTLQGDGGGIMLKSRMLNTFSKKFSLYLTDAASIVEGTDLIDNKGGHLGSTSRLDWGLFSIMGLPSGSYVARFKNNGAGGTQFYNTFFEIVDTVEPDKNKYVPLDISNDDQSICRIVNGFRFSQTNDSEKNIVNRYYRSGINHGETNFQNQELLTPVNNTYRDETATIASNNYYNHGVIGRFDTDEDAITFNAPCKSVGFNCFWQNTSTNNVAPFIDGRSTPNILNTQTVSKNGAASTSGTPTAWAGVFKLFELDITMSDASTITTTDTRGFFANKEVILEDNVGAQEKAIINVVTTDTSVTLKQALSTLAFANVVKVYFYGNHTLKVKNDASSTFQTDVMIYEPLTIARSKDFSRVNQTFTTETKTLLFNGISNGDNFYFPIHSDGTQGDIYTSTIEVVGLSNSTATYAINGTNRSVEVSTGTLNIKVTSTKMVPKPTYKEVF